MNNNYLSLLPLTRIFKQHVENTLKKAIITLEEIHLCNLTFAVKRGIDVRFQKVYISTKCLKHIYDKRPPDEFALVLKYLPVIIKYPSYITENKPGRRGDFFFVKKITDKTQGLIEIGCTIEIVKSEEGEIIKEDAFVATAFLIRDHKYLSTCKLIWSWKGDKPSS